MNNNCLDISLGLGLVDHNAASRSGSDIDSDLESALYSQLHHEPNLPEVIQVPEFSNIAPSAHYIDYFCGKLIHDAQTSHDPPRRPDRYDGSHYSRHGTFMPNYSEEFKYQTGTKTFSNKRFFNSPLLTDRPNKIQRREVNNELTISSDVYNDVTHIQNDSNKFQFREVNTFVNTVKPILYPSEEVSPEVFIHCDSRERHAFRAGGSEHADRPSKEAYELITLGDSPLHQRKNNHGKKNGPPYIQWMLEPCASSGHRKRKPNVTEEKVIDITDSPVVVSDTTIDVPSSSDDDDLIMIDKDQASDILTNLEGCRPAEEPQLDFREEDILKKMSGNPELWRIGEKDRFPESYRQTSKYKRKFRQLRVMCSNCREHGHWPSNCNKPRRLAVCFLCGSRGHKPPECPLPACERCMRLGHQAQQCRWPPKNLEKECPSCKMKGHLREECPDHWRKYHLTTCGNSIITNSSSEHAAMKLSCYNCGRPGHLGHQCKMPRMGSYVCPSLPWVVNYNNPSACVGTQKGKKSGKTPKERGKVLRKLYRKKQRIVEASNERYADMLANKTTCHKKRFGLNGPKKKKKKPKWRRAAQTIVRNGQIYYPRECGAMGNSGRNLQEKMEMALAKKQTFFRRWHNKAEKFTSKFQMPTWNATEGNLRTWRKPHSRWQNTGS